MHSTQPLLNRAENHSKAMNLAPLVWILCALVTVLSVVVGNLYHQQNQFQELLTNEAPVSKEIAVRSMTPMVMNHQTMFEGSHMDMSKLVAEEFTEDSAQYLTDLYIEHFGGDDFEELVGGAKTEKFKTWIASFKTKTGQAVKFMQKTVYAVVRAILVMFKMLKISLNQVTAGTTGLNLQFTFTDDATALIKTLTDQAEGKETPKETVGGGKDATGFFTKARARFYKVAAKGLAAYRHFVCNTGLRLKGFQFILSSAMQVGFTVLLDTDMKVVEAFEKKFDADLSDPADGGPESCNMVSTVLVNKDFSDTDMKDEQTYFPFDDPKGADANLDTAETDLSGKTSDRQS